MSRKSEQVKEWRRRTKERLIKAFGGVCCVCNRRFNDVVYDFHHVEGEKESKLSDIARGSIRSWGKIVEEVRKCVMTCSNCHRLVHTKLVEIPEHALRFDETCAYYSPYVYPHLRTKEGFNVYHLVINKFRKKSYYHESSSPPKKEFEHLFNNNKVTSLARRFKVSHTTIRRWAKKYNLV